MTKKLFFLFITILFFSRCSNRDTIPLEQLETTNTIYTLPIVVHIIHSGEQIGTGFNLSEERILQQLEILNNDFRKKAGTLGHNTHPLGTDVKIEFKLTEKDPNERPTNGITRTNYKDVIIHKNNNWLFEDMPH